VRHSSHTIPAKLYLSAGNRARRAQVYAGRKPVPAQSTGKHFKLWGRE